MDVYPYEPKTEGLNPYSTGRYSVRPKYLPPQKRQVSLVLILILLEDTLWEYEKGSYPTKQLES